MDYFASVEVVEFGWTFGFGGSSLMARPLASDSEREAEPTDVHGVDHRKKYFRGKAAACG